MNRTANTYRLCLAGLFTAVFLLLICGCGENASHFSRVEAGTVPTVPDSALSRSGDFEDLGLGQHALAGERYAVFHTREPLVSHDTNGLHDVYLKDLELQTVELLSIGDAGPGNGPSRFASVSRDGRFVVFESDASNLVAGDDNRHRDLFLSDRTNGEITRIAAGNGVSWDAQISGSGQVISFASTSSDLVPGDTNGFADCFVYYLVDKRIRRFSLAWDGSQIEGSHSLDPAIGSEGHMVAFVSRGSNLPGHNGFFQVYGVRLDKNRLFHLSRNASGYPADGHCLEPDISRQAKRLLFRSDAENLVPEDSNGFQDLFLFDYDQGLSLVSKNSSGQPLNGPTWAGVISSDGTKVGLVTIATNAVNEDEDPLADIILRDLATGLNTLVSVNSGGGKTNLDCWGVSISESGEGCLFSSASTNLHPEDTDSASDVFWRQTTTNTTSLVSAPFPVSLAGLERLEILPEAPWMKTGTTRVLTVTGHYQDGSTVNLTNYMLFRSSAPDLVSVDNAAGRRGQFTGERSGTAELSAVLQGTGFRISTKARCLNYRLVGSVPLTGQVYRMIGNPDGSLLYALLSDQLVVIDLNTRTVVRSVPLGGSGMALSPDSSTLLVAGARQSVEAIDTTTWQVITIPLVGAHVPRDVDFLSNEKAFAIGDRGAILTLDIATKQHIPRVPEVLSDGSAFFLRVDPLIEQIVVAERGISPSSFLRFRLDPQGKPVEEQDFRSGGNGRSLAVNPGSGFVFPCGGGNNGPGYPLTYYSPSGTSLGDFDIGTYPRHAAFSSDGEVLFGVNGDAYDPYLYICRTDTVSTFLKLPTPTIGGYSRNYQVEPSKDARWLFLHIFDDYYDNNYQIVIFEET